MESKEIEVNLMDMKKAEYPDTLLADLGPCVAIGIYHPETRSGYMMHEPHFQHTDLDGKIQKIQEDYGSLSRLRVFVAGNSLASDDNKKQREYERANRPFVEEVLKKYFQKSQVRIRWMPDNHSCGLYLHTSTGKFQLDVDDLNDLDYLEID
ncbi:MAG: hypothetical protein ABIF40_05845 [archaeon]